MGIIILAAAFMYPTIRNFLKNRKIDVAGRVLVGAMQEARSEAVTKRKPYYVVFLQRGVMVFSGATKEFEGGFRPISRDETITYQALFANEGERYKEEILQSEPRYDKEEDLRLGREVCLRFDPAGTVDFLRFQDVSSIEFRNNRGADILVEQGGGSFVKGFIDVRAAGAVSFKIEELASEEGT